MHRILTQESPFWDDDSAVRLNKILNDELDFEAQPNLRKLSEPGRAILLAMLEKDADKRPSIREIYRHRWFDGFDAFQ